MTQHLHILLIEDDPLDAELIIHELSRAKTITIERVDTENEFIRALQDSPPEIILSDFNLPRFDAITALSIARSRVPDIPFIIVSGAIGEEQAVRTLKEGAADYVMKTDLGKLNSAVEHALAISDEKNRRRRIEEALERLRRRTSLILESAAEGIIGLYEDETITFINPAGLKILGYTGPDIIGSSCRVLWNNPGLSFSLDKHINETGDLLRGDGTTFPAEFTSSPIIEKGHIAGAVMVIRDISRRVRTEAELRDSIIKMKKNLYDIINALSLAIESRDPYTAGHQKQVSRLAETIARTMELPDFTVEGIRLAALVHDVGKIQVPAEILAKPGRLAEPEYLLVQNHPMVGYDILKDIDFPWPIALIVKHHHERIDGSGYPDRLKGGQIMLEARIIAVADTVEAMASHRPYRPALGIEKSMMEIHERSGTWYDPDVVSACESIFSGGSFTL